MPQLQNLSRFSCHRGDSPTTTTPVNRVCTSGTEDCCNGVIVLLGPCFSKSMWHRRPSAVRCCNESPGEGPFEYIVAIFAGSQRPFNKPPHPPHRAFTA